jgi:hypothetical protein
MIQYAKVNLAHVDKRVKASKKTNQGRMNQARGFDGMKKTNRQIYS